VLGCSVGCVFLGVNGVHCVAYGPWCVVCVWNLCVMIVLCVALSFFVCVDLCGHVLVWRTVVRQLFWMHAVWCVWRGVLGVVCGLGWMFSFCSIGVDVCLCCVNV